MRWCRGMLMPAAAICAPAVITGCTIYTEPSHVAESPGPARAVHTAVPPPPGPRTGARVSIEGGAFSTFYQALSPAGWWMDRPVCGADYGRVWRPDPDIVGPDFVPYQTGGEWVETDQGWAFVSDYDWGWATFHYGRWCDDARYGWVWIPGDEWAPAWVDWRVGGGYVGWAPLPPPGAGSWATRWIFVEKPYFSGRRVTRYALPPPRMSEARRVTRPVGRVKEHHGYTWFAGPAPEEVRGAESRPVHIVPPAKGSVRRVIIRRH